MKPDKSCKIVRAVSAAVCCCLFAACSRNAGRETNAYLRAHDQIMAGLAKQLGGLPAVEIPTRPTLPPFPTPEERRSFAEGSRGYAAAVARYFEAFATRAQSVSGLLEQTQGRLAALKPSRVDIDAIRFVHLHEDTMGERREALLELARLAEMRRIAVIQRQGAEELDELLASAFDGALAGMAAGRSGSIPARLTGALDAAGRIAAKDQAVRDAIGGQLTRATVAVAEFRRDAIQLEATCAQLATNLQGKYPGQDWTFMVGP